MYLFWKRGRREKEEDRLLKRDFKAALDGLCVGLRAGYSVENAFSSVIGELSRELKTDSRLLSEFRYMEGQKLLGVSLSTLFLELGNRTGLEDIKNVAQVFSAAKRTGGDLSEIFQKTGKMLGDKLEVEEEIEASLASRKNEQLIMNIMPAAIILYLKLTSPGFLKPLYGNAIGAGIMTGCLLLYGAAWWLGNRILDIWV